LTAGLENKFICVNKIWRSNFNNFWNRKTIRAAVNFYIRQIACLIGKENDLKGLVLFGEFKFSLEDGAVLSTASYWSNT